MKKSIISRFFKVNILLLSLASFSISAMGGNLGDDSILNGNLKNKTTKEAWDIIEEIAAKLERKNETQAGRKGSYSEGEVRLTPSLRFYTSAEFDREDLLSGSKISSHFKVNDSNAKDKIVEYATLEELKNDYRFDSKTGDIVHKKFVKSLKNMVIDTINESNINTEGIPELLLK